MVRTTLVAATALVAAALVTTASARTASPKLSGTVGPGFTISLKSAGVKVKTLKAGTYTLTVADRARIHSFVLEQQSGGGFDKAITSVRFTGTKTVQVTLRRGKWKYYCSAHEASMFGFFTVT